VYTANSDEGGVRFVAKDDEHRFSKQLAGEIRLLTGLGVQGDAHEGITVKHRSRVAVDPTQPPYTATPGLFRSRHSGVCTRGLLRL